MKFLKFKARDLFIILENFTKDLLSAQNLTCIDTKIHPHHVRLSARLKIRPTQFKNAEPFKYKYKILEDRKILVKVLNS
jgi:hypothetical protein